MILRQRCSWVPLANPLYRIQYRAHRPVIANLRNNIPWTPSNDLIAALEATNHGNAVPLAFPDKIDLSHNNVRAVWRKNKARPRLQGQPSRRTLQAILAEYIKSVDAIWPHSEIPTAASSETHEVDRALLHHFTDETVAFLELRGYGAEDLMSWAWIITAENSERAALRLIALSSWKSAFSRNVPTFVFLFLLRRRLFSVRALRALLIHGWDRLLGRRSLQLTRYSTDNTDDAVKSDSWSMRRWKRRDSTMDVDLKMDETTAIIMIVRLLRHARVLWPQAIVSIAAMISTHVNGLGSSQQPAPSGVLSERTSARLAFVYNRALSLLSVPSSLHPLQHVAYYQRAQFNLIRRMAQFDPALTVNREGYRAIIRVQVAHHKTVKERIWARMKAKSWPPWKEEKLGIDAEKGFEDGVSRASESLLRLNEAGYSNYTWENVASVYAGWDTDHSPTIQTRALLRRPSYFRKSHSSNAKDQEYGSSVDTRLEFCASRIRATRTIEEAWACFLATENEKLHPSQEVYYAMFEKLVFDSKLRRTKSVPENPSEHDPTRKEDDEVLPGDSREVCLAPVSPQEATYVRLPPPSLGDLFDRMVTDGIRPAGRCLAFLLAHAGSLDDGLKYLCSSKLPPGPIKALITPDINVARNQIADLRSLPDYMFAAFIQLLCKFAASANPAVGPQQKGMSASNGKAENSKRRVLRQHPNPTSPLLHAVRLMNLRKPQYRPPWISILTALARTGVRISSDEKDRSTAVQDMTAWKVMLEVERQMGAVGLSLDSQVFQTLCIGLEKAVIASQRILKHDRSSAPSIIAISAAQAPGTNLPKLSDPPLRRDAKDVLLNGIISIKAAFGNLVDLNNTPASRYFGLKYMEKAPLKEGELMEPTALLPRLLTVPGPAALHAYTRVLGFVRDYDAMLALLRWMQVYAPEVQAVADESRNGQRLLRRTLIATRVFLERSWNFGSEHDQDNGPQSLIDSAPEQVIRDVAEIIEGMDGWGGWPTDDEVEAYCRKGRFI